MKKLNWLNNAIFIDDNLSSKLPFVFSNEITFESINVLKNFYQLWSNIILEYPSAEADYGQTILNDLNNNQTKIILTKTDFLKYIPKTWKYYNQLKNRENFQVFIVKFDFSNSETDQFSLLNFINEFYDVQFSKQSHALAFKQQTQFSKGIIKSLIKDINSVDTILMFLNTNKLVHYDKSTINHKLFHIFQELLNIHIFNDNSLLPALTKYDLQYCENYLNFSKSDLDYYFSRNEFWNFVHNDLVDYLITLKNILYFHLNNQEFLTFILDQAKNQQNLNNDLMFNFLKAIFYFQKCLNINEIINILTETFNN